MSDQQPYSDVFDFHYEVIASDIDTMNHVNNLEYLRWTLRAAHSHSHSLGWTADRFRAFGAGFIVRSHNIKYRVPALLGDHVIVLSLIHI